MMHIKEFFQGQAGRQYIRNMLAQHSQQEQWQVFGRLGNFLKTNLTIFVLTTIFKRMKKKK